MDFTLPNRRPFQPFFGDDIYDLFEIWFPNNDNGNPVTFGEFRDFICVTLYKYECGHQALFDGLDGSWGSNFLNAIENILCLSPDDPRRALVVNDLLAYFKGICPPNIFPEEIVLDGVPSSNFNIAIGWIKERDANEEVVVGGRYQDRLDDDKDDDSDLAYDDEDAG